MLIRRILHELKDHAPFTFLGAITGIVMMIFFRRVPHEIAYDIFYVLHPMHVLLSAVVTTSMYMIYRCGGKRDSCRFWEVILIGYFGSVGIATLSDCVIPYVGEVLLHLPNRGAHLGFIEEWWIVNPLAFLGIVIAYFMPTTKLPHSGHVLVSTWASLFHMIMALGFTVDFSTYFVLFVFLFISVWAPCCVSDIVFPLLFVRGEAGERCGCVGHDHI